MSGETTVRSYRMSEADFARVKSAAEQQGKRPSAFVREAALVRSRLSEPTRTEPTLALLSLDQEQMIRGLVINLRGVRGLLNQIAKKLNVYDATQSGEPPLLEDCESAIGTADKTVKDIQKTVSAWGVNI